MFRLDVAPAFHVPFSLYHVIHQFPKLMPVLDAMRGSFSHGILIDTVITRQDSSRMPYYLTRVRAI